MPSESWTLDSLSLSSGAFDLIELTADPPAQRPNWITAADSESAALFRQPLHENRTITMKLKVRQQPSMDTALDRVGALVDKLRKASASTSGIGLVWTPNDSARSVTFTVLAGEISGMPIGLSDEGYLWVLRQPVVAVSLTCQPYWIGTETLTSTNSSSTPLNAFEITGVTGDIPALGRIIITDTATQSRRHVEWGIEGPLTYNSSTSLIVDSDNMVSGWIELDLGTITVPAVTLGTQRWTGQVEVQGDATTPGTVALDYLILVPQADGYGKSRAAWSYSSGVLVAYDTFTTTTAGNALNTRVAPLGGTWATSGDATDFVFSDNFSGTDGIESLSRTVVVSETTGRFAILGATNYTDSQIDARARFILNNTEQALILRWVDASNFLRLKVNSATGVVTLEQVVAGTPTTLATPATGTLGTFTQLTFRFRLIAYASGLAIVTVTSDDGLTSYGSAQAVSTALATGGVLATGKPGIGSRSTSAVSSNHHWDDIAVTTPATEPMVIYSGRNMQVRYDDTLRQDSTATYYGRTPSYRGSRFLVPVGTSRVLVKARRNDIETSLDDQVTDALQIQIGWTPRGLAVPR
jgi:hypothetical protein